MPEPELHMNYFDAKRSDKLIELSSKSCVATGFGHAIGAVEFDQNVENTITF